MESTYPKNQESTEKAVPKPNNRTVALGFRSFKLVNSNIKLVKKIDVKTVKLPALSYKNGKVLVAGNAAVPTAEGLRKINEKIKARTNKLSDSAPDSNQQPKVVNVGKTVVEVIPFDNGINGLVSRMTDVPDDKKETSIVEEKELREESRSPSETSELDIKRRTSLEEPAKQAYKQNLQHIPSESGDVSNVTENFSERTEKSLPTDPSVTANLNQEADNFRQQEEAIPENLFNSTEIMHDEKLEIKKVIEREPVMTSSHNEIKCTEALSSDDNDKTNTLYPPKILSSTETSRDSPENCSSSCAELFEVLQGTALCDDTKSLFPDQLPEDNDADPPIPDMPEQSSVTTRLTDSVTEVQEKRCSPVPFEQEPTNENDTVTENPHIFESPPEKSHSPLPPHDLLLGEEDNTPISPSRTPLRGNTSYQSPEITQNESELFLTEKRSDLHTVKENNSNSRIPKISSDLKTVFESILHIGFNKNSHEGSDPIRPNGVIHTTNSSIKNALKDPRLKRFNCVTQNVMPTNEPGVDNHEKRLDSLDSGDPLSLKANYISQGNRLKLHATTKTPLPAKKSYIQQAQNSSELCPLLANDQNNSTLPATRPLTDDPEPVTTLPTTPLDEGSNLMSEQNIDRSCCSESVGADEATEEGKGQDDPGLRRSARIKTKKSEKTKAVYLGKFTNCDGNSSGTSLSIPGPIRSASMEESFSDIANFTPDLSEVDYFKMKINLEVGSEDLPEMFEVLDENVYLNPKKKSRARKEIRRMVCECAFEENLGKGEVPCGENCLNRLLMIECSSRCEFGDQCTNKRFQQKRYSYTEVFKTSFKGWGIRAACDIEAGQLVMEYCGEVVDQREFAQRSLEYSESNHEHFYFMALSQDEIIDATFKGNSSRFINHSCDPNAETQKWTVNGRLRVGFFTLRKISKGEEITFDYQFERYGKVAQKCYCGTSKCRGYLGKAPDDSEKKSGIAKMFLEQSFLCEGVQVTQDSVSQEQIEKGKRKSKKRLGLLQDDTMEKDLSKLLGGLRSSKEVLNLSRLMVRCDTYAERNLCLQVLKETSSQTRLKTFLQFHGLSIIWSWMVDISGSEDEDSHLLKLDIITTLSNLPISNRNIIEDSKVLSVVQRWAKQTPDADSPAVEDHDGNEEGINESPKQDQPQDDNKQSVPCEETKEENSDKEKMEELNDVKESPEPSDEVTTKVSSEETKSESDIISAAENLLLSWKDLREVFRIPKRRKPSVSSEQDSSSRETSHSQSSSPAQKRSYNDDFDKIYRQGGGRSSQENNRDRGDSQDSKLRHRDRKSDSKDFSFSPSHHRNEGRMEPAYRKRRFSTDSDDQSLGGHSRSLHFRLSRQEYRKKFEKDVRKREEEKKRRVEVISHLDPLMPQNVPVQMNNQILVPNQGMSILGQDMGIMQQQATFTPSGYSGNLIQINPTQPSPIGMEPYLAQPGNPVLMQPAANSYAMQLNMQQSYAIQGMYAEDPSIQNVYQQSLEQQAQVGYVGHQMIANSSVPLVVDQQQAMQQQTMLETQPIIQQQTGPVQPSNLTILGSQNGQAIVLLTAEQLNKLTGSSQSTPVEEDHTKKQAKPSSSGQNCKTNVSKSNDKTRNNSEVTDPSALPPNWKIANDSEGRVYYYHVITRQTQWDRPTWDGREEDMVGKKEAEMELSTPTYDERQEKNENSNLSKEGKKAKEAFRLAMSKFVVQCLGPFRRKDRRINSTENFKHLARKLTHNIVRKEMKQVQVLEDLDFDNNVMHKAKEYIEKYMNNLSKLSQSH